MQSLGNSRFAFSFATFGSSATLCNLISQTGFLGYRQPVKCRSWVIEGTVDSAWIWEYIEVTQLRAYAIVATEVLF